MTLLGYGCVMRMSHGLESKESRLGRRFRRILCSYWLKNIINSPTRITSDSKSLIDLIVTSQPVKVQTSGSIDLGISDHHLIFAVFKVARSNPQPQVILTKKYKQVDKKQLNTDFVHAPWHLVNLFDDMDDCPFIWKYFTTTS